MKYYSVEKYIFNPETEAEQIELFEQDLTDAGIAYSKLQVSPLNITFCLMTEFEDENFPRGKFEKSN